jgi:penicillin G amidase
VGPAYPYYIGTSGDDFDPGYRADVLYSYLGAHTAMTIGDFARLQSNTTDDLAAQIVPRLLAAMRGDPALDAAERAAVRQLGRWNYQMTAGSSGGAIWFTFWTDYVSGVFGPWWSALRVPIARDPAALTPNWQQVSIDEDVQAWTLTDPANPAFTAPGQRRQTAAQAMRAAFARAVDQLSAKLGDRPADWTWGRLHETEIPSVVGAAALGYGPRPAGGDIWTVDDADQYPVSSKGPSWRMIVKWTGDGAAEAKDIYPGGQSENPASPWYADMISDWWNDRYLTMPPAAGYRAGSIRWSLLPGGAP